MSDQCRSIEDLPVEASSALGDAASTAGSGVTIPSTMTAMEFLLQAGGPVLFVPISFTAPSSPGASASVGMEAGLPHARAVTPGSFCRTRTLAGILMASVGTIGCFVANAVS